MSSKESVRVTAEEAASLASLVAERPVLGEHDPGGLPSLRERLSAAADAGEDPERADDSGQPVATGGS